MTRLSRGLAEAGYAVLRFDFTGLGESAGTFAETSVSTKVSDLGAAAATLVDRGFGPCAMIGHSLGGTAALLAAHRLHTVRSLVVLGSPATPHHVRHLFAEQVEEIEAQGQALVDIAGRRFPISAEFLADLDRHETERRVAELERPLLVLHALDDETVGIDQGEQLFALAHQPKAFVPLFDADHLLTSRRSAEQALAAVRDWLSQTL